MKIIETPEGRIKVGVFPWEVSRAPKRCNFDFAGDVCKKFASPHYCAPRVAAAIWLAEQLVIPEGPKAGEFFKLAKWHRRVFVLLFGIVVWSKTYKIFVRRFQRLWIIVARKNAKTTLAAILCVMFLLMGRQGPQIVMAAQTLESADDVIGRMVRGICENSPICKVYGVYPRDSGREWHRDANMGFIKTVPSDGSKIRGKNIALGVIDEVLTNDDSQDFIDNCEDGWGTRPEPLQIACSTPSWNELSFERSRSREYRLVLKNPDLDPLTLAVMFEPSKNDDLWSPATWRKANPGFDDDIKSEEEVAAKAQAARGKAREESRFFREHVCAPAGEEDAFVSMTQWDLRVGVKAGRALTFFECRELLKGLPLVWAGLDLSQTSDLTSLVLAGWDPGRRELVCAQWSWVPAQVANSLDAKLQGKLSEWIRLKDDAGRGCVTTLESGELMTERIAGEVSEILLEYPNLVDVGYDLWRALRVEAELLDLGIQAFKLKQGPMLTPAIWEVRDYVHSGGLVHGGCPVLRYYMQSSVLKKMPADEAMIVKPDRDTDSRRVDGTIALLCAVMRMQAYRSSLRVVSGISVGGAKLTASRPEDEKKSVGVPKKRKLVVV